VLGSAAGAAMMDARARLSDWNGVANRYAAEFARQGIETLEDLLFVLPFRYEDRRRIARVRDLVPGMLPATLEVRVTKSRLIRTRKRGFSIFEAQLADDSGEIKGVWYNQPYLGRVLVAGRRVVVFGRVGLDRYGRQRILEGPEVEVLEEDEAEGIHTGRIVPVYRKLGGLSTRSLRRVVWRILTELDLSQFPEPMPREIAREQGLPGRLEALRGVHFPAADADLESLDGKRTPCHRALAFEEAYLVQLALLLRRRANQEAPRAVTYEVPDALRVRLARLLPFRLTAAQQRALREIRADLARPSPMNRLLQGDVGSGKTIVALLAMLLAAENGAQAALMAPTEILAEQHFRSFERILGAQYRIARLTGSTRAAGRKKTLASIASGETQLIVGTHALFDAKVDFRRLGLVVVDEQHRFGVLQRAALAAKGGRPDVLVMTATPIPRSMALTLYGDLDLSVLDELPPGRTPVKTVVRGEPDRERVYRGVREAVERGRQVFVVVPLVEETESTDLKAAVAFARELPQGALAGIRVGLVHGRLKGPEKDAVMRDFAQGALPVLVATTVVEVGVDVPNASVMVVEHAERFGLSQLHQLRGRVGRGKGRSYCVLMVGAENAGEAARARLDVMGQTNDGFRIAETDLRIRGPGAVFGTWQHGLSDLQFLAVLVGDPGLLDAARSAAAARIATPAGARAAEATLASLRGSWRSRLELARIG